MRPGEVHGRNDVGDAVTARDEVRAVPDHAGRIVGIIAWLQQAPSEARPEVGNGRGARLRTDSGLGTGVHGVPPLRTVLLRHGRACRPAPTRTDQVWRI